MEDGEEDGEDDVDEGGADELAGSCIGVGSVTRHKASVSGRNRTFACGTGVRKRTLSVNRA